MSTSEPNSSDNTNGTSWENPEPTGSRIFRYTLFSVTILCAVVGNTIICRMIVKYSGKKTFIHYLVFNLALAELVFSVCQAFIFHQYETRNGWVLGSGMCTFLFPVQLACGIATTIILAEIAVYRHLVLRKAVFSRSRFNRRRSLWIISATWAIAIILAIPTGVYHRLDVYQGTTYCFEEFPEDQQHKQTAYSFLIFVTNYVLPLALICVSYTLVCVRVRQHIVITTSLIEQQQQQQEQARGGLSSTKTEEVKLSDMAAVHAGNGEKISPNAGEIIVVHRGPAAGDGVASRVKGESRPRKKKRGRGKCGGQATLALENDLLKMIYAIIVVYVICYLPYQICFLLYQFNVMTYTDWKFYFVFTRYLVNMICLPSALHPFMYGMMSKFFRCWGTGN